MGWKYSNFGLGLNKRVGLTDVFYASILSSSSKRIFRIFIFNQTEMGKRFVRFWVLVPLRLMVQWNQYFPT